MYEATPRAETEFVFRRLTETLHLAGKEISGYLWLALLIPVLIAAIVYVIAMYVRDSRSVGGVWATFLATLRCAVYGILALVFLLPAWLTWDIAETRSRVVLVFDVSGSTATKDDLPSESMPVEKLLSRQDKVLRFLTDPQIHFLKRLQAKNPVVAYRFGGQLDEEFKVFQGDQEWSADDWDAWLKPNPKEEVPNNLNEEEQAQRRKKVELQALLVNGTNLGDAVLGVINRERNNMLQGIVVVSDGRSTQYSAQTFLELEARASRDKIPIFTVGVGEHRLPVNIRITDVLTPDQARPDDQFPIRVEVDGEGLPDKNFTAALDIYKPGADLKKDKPAHQLTAKSQFSGSPPHAQVEFPIEAAQLPAGLRQADPSAKSGTPAKPELEEGEWKFVARVPRDPQEAFLGKEHVSDPATVNVVKKPLRILLFSSGPTRDYQFLRSLLVREADHGRAELSVCLQRAQEGTVQDVPKERLLSRFPGTLQAVGTEAEDKYDNLNQYDLVIAFDPDWLQLLPEQMANLEKWVEAGGGLVVVAGPIHTFQLARGVNADKVKPLLDLYPVILDDSRIQSLGMERSTAEGHRLNFPGATNEMEFLKLDENQPDLLAGWEEFFTGQAKPEPGKEPTLRRGFYDFYPVKDKKPSATVIATFSDPRARLSDGREQPYLVSMPFKRGKVVYLSSGEVWRLRQYHEAFHERFWTKLARFAAAGSMGAQKNPSNIYMNRV
ncbi:MAG: hypothetical protein JO112_06260, partial [Planctomycetes bacterium]|nr:hypothetical protein [Planctomycetota bacterium]